MKTPESLLEATRKFNNADSAHEYLTQLRWPNGVIPCPKCGHTEHYYLATQRRWKCKLCKKQFSVKVGTIFEDSPIGLDKWLIAVWLITNAKNGISSCELARSLKVTQKTAWFMNHRIRLAMQNGSFDKMEGTVEADETFIGGKAKNMHAYKRENVKGRGPSTMITVMGLLQRPGIVKAMVLPDTTATSIQAQVRKFVKPGSSLFTDAHGSYRGLKGEYSHEYTNHLDEYVRGEVHTNNIENFWSCLKRCIKGTYISVEPFHLFRYLDEQTFRYNNRKLDDGQRFDSVGSSIAGKRLTYKVLTGKEYAAIR